MTVALIDGDILVYRCGFAAEKTKYLVQSGEFVDGIYEAHKDIPKDVAKDRIWKRKEVEPVENALNACKATIEFILEKLGTDKYEIYLSGKGSFREKLAVTAPYKGNRETQEKPVHYRAIRDYLEKQWGAVAEPGYEGLEADDRLGIRSRALGDGGVVVSIDKDLLQLSGRHYNWVQDIHISVSPREGAINLGCQILSGDPTDNVGGLPGIGPIKAQKLLSGVTDPRSMVARIREMYSDIFQSLGQDRFLECGNLVYILRSEDDSFEKWLSKYE